MRKPCIIKIALSFLYTIAIVFPSPKRSQQSNIFIHKTISNQPKRTSFKSLPPSQPQTHHHRHQLHNLPTQLTNLLRRFSRPICSARRLRTKIHTVGAHRLHWPPAGADASPLAAPSAADSGRPRSNPLRPRPSVSQRSNTDVDVAEDRAR